MKKLLHISLVFSCMIFFGTWSAQAHTDLVSSSPADQAIVREFPHYIELTFNEDLLIISGKQTNFITVTDTRGVNLTQGEVKINGRSLTQPLQPIIARTGVFTVEYRVVAIDGHRVVGRYSFTLEGTSTTPSIAAPTTGQSPSVATQGKESFINRNLNAIGGVLIVITLIIGHFIYRRLRG